MGSTTAIYLSDTYVSRFNYSQLYENTNIGLRLDNGSNVVNDQLLNKQNLIANNSLGIPESPLNFMNTNIYISALCDFDFPLGTYQIYHDWPGDGSTYLFSIMETGHVLDVVYNYWHNLSTPAEIEALCYAPGTLTVYADPMLSLPAIHHEYWQLNSEEDSLNTLLLEAYDLIGDTLPEPYQIEEAIEIFGYLADRHYSRAIHGLRTALWLQGESPSGIEDVLCTYLSHPDSTMDDFDRALGFACGSVHRENGDFEEAIYQFESLAGTTPFFEDSIQALIQIEETIRLEALSNNPPEVDDDRESGSHTDRSRIIALADLRIRELNEELHGYYAWVNTQNTLPTEFTLQAAYPNPFNPTVTIPYSLPNASDVQIRIYNLLGQEVANLVNRPMEAGFHSVVWNGESASGSQVASGVYFVRMQAGQYVNTRKVVLLR